MDVYHREGRLWGFDSFLGFPEPTNADRRARNVQQGELGDTSPDLVRQRLISAGADEQFVRERTSLVAGYFEESLVRYDGSSIALLHVDVDLYESYLTVLGALYGFVAPGGRCSSMSIATRLGPEPNTPSTSSSARRRGGSSATRSRASTT